jgi:hypothetical protein
MGASKQVPVQVDGETVDVWVTATGKATYTAHATFGGRQIRQTGVTESSAIGNWQKAADYLSKQAGGN